MNLKQFGLTVWTAARCKHVTKREENHGDDLVDAMTIHYEIEFTNDRLDDWFPGLRHAIYTSKNTTSTIDGVPEVTPDKRTDLIESPHHLKTECAGYMLIMRRGAGHSKPMMVEWAGADARDFRLDAKPAGLCKLGFKVNISGLDAETMGRLASMGGREVEIMFVPPKLQEGTMPDGHQPPKGKAKPASSKQMRIPGAGDGAEPAGGSEQQAGSASETPAAEVNPFRFSVRDGEMVDNNPGAGSPFVVGEPPSATELFLDAHAPEVGEFPDDGSGDAEPDDDDDGDGYGDDAAAASTGLADDVVPERSVKRGSPISGKKPKK